MVSKSPIWYLLRSRCGLGGLQVEKVARQVGADGSLVLKVSAIKMGRQCGLGGYWWGDGGKICVYRCVVRLFGKRSELTCICKTFMQRLC